MADQTFKRIGFGQVEPNHLSAQKTGQIYAQLPAKKNISILENGQFVKYDYANGEVNYTGAGEWMMVFNEVKLYGEDWKETYKDFALKAEDRTLDYYYKSESDKAADIRSYVEHDNMSLKGQMVPRVIKTNVGDIFTTNCIGVANTSGRVEVTYTYTADDAIAAGDKLVPGSTGYLQLAGENPTGMVWEVAKVYTLADGQAAFKLVRIQ